MKRYKIQNYDLGKTAITDKIRVSSAIVRYPNGGTIPEYFQYETWIFSDDLRQKSTQVIHGTSHEEHDIYYVRLAKKVHKQISQNLKDKFWISN